MTTMSFSRAITASALMIFTMVCLGYFSRVEEADVKKPLSTFPTQVGEWIGKTDRFDKKVYEMLGVSDSFLCDYRSPDGRQVQLYVGFYRRQDETSAIHSPKNCMPGAGWAIVQSSIEEFSLPHGNPGKAQGIKLVLEKAGQRQIVLYWFQSQGRYIASEYWHKIYLVIDSITRHRTDGAFVRLITPAARNEEEKALRTLKDFAGLMIPVLKEHLPS